MNKINKSYTSAHIRRASVTAVYLASSFSLAGQTNLQDQSSLGSGWAETSRLPSTPMTVARKVVSLGGSLSTLHHADTMLAS